MLRSRSLDRLTLVLLGVWIFVSGCTTGDKQRPKTAFWQREVQQDASTDAELVDADPVQRRINIQLASARSLEMDGTIERAAEVYRTVLADDPQHPAAAHRLAVIYSREGRFADAEPLYRTCLQHTPDSAPLHCDLGYACYLQGRGGEAEQHLRRALELDPALKRAHANLGLVFARSGRTGEALAAFSQAGCTPAEAKSNVAFAAMLDEDWTRAAALYHQALAEQPGLEKAAAGLQTARRMKAQTEPHRLAANNPASAPGQLPASETAPPVGHHRPVSFEAAKRAGSE